MGTRAAVYLRISDDREGQRLGVERQLEDCRRRADREGWEVTEVFEDNDVGASTKSRKARPGYKQLIQCAEDGKLDVILSYSASRLTRRPRELLDLIDLHDKTGVLLKTVVSGDVDLSTADGKAVALTLAAWDSAEAERISERVKRAAKQRREAGEFHGGRPPFGYTRIAKGELEVDPARAEVVREAALRLIGGESIYGIYTDFNRRGIKTAPSPRAPEGTRWSSQTLRRVLTNPATIGCHDLDDGRRIKVAEPILDEAEWHRLREILFHPGRRSATPPDWSSRRKFPLSGLLFCSECGHWLSGAALTGKVEASGERRPSVTSFACVTATGGCGKIRISYEPLERWILDLVLSRLDTAEVQVALPTPVEHRDTDELRQQIADTQRRLERLDDDKNDGLLDEHRYRRQVERLNRRITELRTELAEIQRDVFVIDSGGRTLREVWPEHDATWQRTLLGHVIDKIIIQPHPAGVTTNISRRRGEDDESLAGRRQHHRERLLLQRVHVHWN